LRRGRAAEVDGWECFHAALVWIHSRFRIAI
jgi:hypothetical protein